MRMARAQSRPPAAPPKRRRTQEERSNATREALLDATIDCLVDYGYAGTTTTRVAERAGLSRGAPMHHYQRKAPLVVAALLHLASKRRRELVERARRELPSTAARSGDGTAKADPVAAAVDLLWSTFSGPLFTAALELWIAARTDDELREALLPVEREIGRGARRTAYALYQDAGIDDEEIARRIGPAVELAGNAMRGMALQQLLDSSPARLDRQLKTLKDVLTSYLTANDQARPTR